MQPEHLGDSTGRLSGRDICVAGGTNFEFNAGSYFERHQLMLKKSYSSRRPISAPSRKTSPVGSVGCIRPMCRNWRRFSRGSPKRSTSRFATNRSHAHRSHRSFDRTTHTGSYRSMDDFALISAEELGMRAGNIEDMRKNANVDVQRLLGVSKGNEKALGFAHRGPTMRSRFWQGRLQRSGRTTQNRFFLLPCPFSLFRRCYPPNREAFTHDVPVQASRRDRS